LQKITLENFGVQELNAKEMQGTDGGFLPIAVVIGIWAFQGACCLIALGMKARLDQERK
jgi:lactobin A/cerein 7B family class IIb bacteriocin